MSQQRQSARTAAVINLVVGLALVLGVAAPSRAGGVVSQTNLVTDDQAANPAQVTDPNLLNPWGVSFGPSGSFWVSDNHMGVSTLYSVDRLTNATTIQGLVVTIQGTGGGMGNPTGQVFNSAASTGAFGGNLFLFASEDGSIQGWKGGTTATILQTASDANIYKGTTLDTVGGHSYLLSANFSTGNIDVLKGDTGAPDLKGKFTDPNLPSGYAPFNIRVLGDQIYVTYALQKGNGDDQPGPGHGFVSVFDNQGNFIARVGSMGTLNSPWGLAIAPRSFGGIAGDLLVGNFGDGRVNIFDQKTDTFVGLLKTTDGQPLAIEGLWALTTGNGGSAGSDRRIYFTAGPGGESHGLFGVLQSVPEPSSVVLGLIAGGLLAARWQWKKWRCAKAS
jgi:uncharacterized protein (TIGR03118 family)